MSLTKKILLAIVAGLVVGVIFNVIGQAPIGEIAAVAVTTDFLVTGVLDAVAQIFISSLKLLVVPMVFVSLVCGSCALRNTSSIGKMASKTLLLYLLTTAIAISLALFAGVLIQPGEGINLTAAVEFNSGAVPSFKDVVINIFPNNPIQAMAEGNMLQVIVFSLLMGVGISLCGDAGKRTAEIFEGFNTVIMKMINILMHLAPYGVFCLLARLFADLGIASVVELAAYFFTVVLVLLIHGLVVYSSLFSFFTRLNPLILLKKLRPVHLFAFSTSSSNATMPVTLRAVEKRLGVDNSVASFTVPLGATINMDGTAIMQGVATAFIAQAYGIDLSVSDYLSVVLMATLASIGTAGVPGVGLITLTMVLTQVNLPVEGIALIIGVDRLLDMMRTIVNVTGDSVVTSIVATGEKKLDTEVFYDPNADALTENPDLK